MLINYVSRKKTNYCGKCDWSIIEPIIRKEYFDESFY